MPSTPEVTIVILNWNNAEDTLRCLASVEQLTYPNYEVIVVDNGSVDDSVSQLHTAYPGVTLLETGENLGYAGGNNLGIRYALEEGAAYVWLLNDDILVAPDSLSILVKASDASTDIGFTGPMVYMREQPDRILSAGGVLDHSMQPRHRGLGALDQGQYGNINEVDFLSGCALLVSREAIEKVGLLDEAFFAYGEDIEWCFRGKRADLRVLLVPNAHVWHPDTRLRDQHSGRVMYYITRNHLLFLQKHRLGSRNIVGALLQNAIWLANWSLNPRCHHMKPKRDAVWFAVHDFMLRRFGKSGDM